MGDVCARPATRAFSVIAAVLITLVLASGLFAGWILLQYGVKTTDFGWQAQRLGEEWYVSSVSPDSVAEGSLRPGDQLLAMNGEKLSGLSTLGLALRSVAGYSLYNLRISRGGKQLEVWLRADARPESNFLSARLPLLCAAGLFFLAGISMLMRWDNQTARLGFMASMAASLRMGSWALLPLAGFFRPEEFHAYYLFCLPVGMGLPAIFHALLVFSDREKPDRRWWSCAAVLYALWGSSGFTILTAGAVAAPVPDGIAMVYWDHVSYDASTTLFSAGFPLLLLMTVALCAARIMALLKIHRDGDVHRRLKWILTAGLLFALPMALFEAAKWLGFQYDLATSWLASLTAICAGYALATESVTSPAMMGRGAAAALLPDRTFRRLDRKLFHGSWLAEETLLAAQRKIDNSETLDECRATAGEAIRKAFSPESFSLHERYATGELIEIGEKLSREPYTRREERLVDQMESSIISLHHRLQRAADAPRPAAPQSPQPAMNLMHECPRCGSCYDSTVVRCPNDGEPPAVKLPVELIVDGKYRLERLIGRGGMGSVYVARDLRLDRRIALKIMLSELFGHQSAQKRFEREARLAARLNHANIVQVYDFGAIGTLGAYQVMELVEGRTWRQEVDRGEPIAAAECLPWIEQLLDGVEAAHRAGIIHRDLKPENLLLVEHNKAGPQLKILDFGLAKMQLLDLSREERISLGVTTIGTVGYVPPEQIVGGRVDERSDIYAIARIIVETLTGQLPASGSNGLSPSLSAVLDRCTFADQEQRFPSIAELRKQLLPALAPIQSSPGPNSSKPLTSVP